MAVATPAYFPDAEGTFSMPALHTLQRPDVMFDDDHAVANAGLALASLLAAKLGVEE